MRIGTWNLTSDTVWVMRYGPRKKGRVIDDRPLADTAAAATEWPRRPLAGGRLGR